MTTPGTFEKSFNRSDKTKCVKKCGKQIPKIIFREYFAAAAGVTGAQTIYMILTHRKTEACHAVDSE